MNKEDFEYALGLLYFLDNDAGKLRPLKNLILSYMQKHFDDFKVDEVLWIEEIKTIEAIKCFSFLLSYTDDYKDRMIIRGQIATVRKLTEEEQHATRN